MWVRENQQQQQQINFKYNEFPRGILIVVSRVDSIIFVLCGALLSFNFLPFFSSSTSVFFFVCNFVENCNALGLCACTEYALYVYNARTHTHQSNVSFTIYTAQHAHDTTAQAQAHYNNCNNGLHVSPRQYSGCCCCCYRWCFANAIFFFFFSTKGRNAVMPTCVCFQSFFTSTVYAAWNCLNWFQRT